jgi:putative holliday junction resolvase
MRLLGIDYGTKKVGLALTDDGGNMAFPHSVIKNDTSLVDTIVALIEEKGVAEVVIGHSLGRDGTANKVHEGVTELVTDLTLACGVPVHLEPEQYTTQEAIRFQGRTEHTDAAAASIILNSYLTRNK